MPKAYKKQRDIFQPNSLRPFPRKRHQLANYWLMKNMQMRWALSFYFRPRIRRLHHAR